MLSRKVKINGFWFKVGVDCLLFYVSMLSLLLLLFSVPALRVWSVIIILVGVCLEEKKIVDLCWLGFILFELVGNYMGFA